MKTILITSILFATFQVSAVSFEPGLWKSKESFKLNGIPLPSSEGEECLTKEQTKDAKATIETELQKKGCTLTKWSLKNKKLEASLKCDNKDMNATGNLSGDFSRKSYDLTGEAKGKYKNAIPASAKLKLTGQWVSACKK